MPDEFIVFGAPDIQQAEIDEVVDSLEAGWLGTGPKVQQFEQDFAAYKGVDSNCAAALNSCTAALHVSLLAAGVKPGDEVITTAMTFCATANAAIHAGATPVPVDIDPATLNIDPGQIEARITDRTRAIVPVHFAGRPCNMDAIMRIANKHNLLVIEDCAHAIEVVVERADGLVGRYAVEEIQLANWRVDAIRNGDRLQLGIADLGRCVVRQRQYGEGRNNGKTQGA